MKIRIVSAIVSRREGVSKEELERGQRQASENRAKLYHVCAGTEVDTVGIEKGSATIESRYDEIFAVPEIVRRVQKAEKEGVDACIINCFADPGVRASREVVKMLVLGPCESSLMAASALCNKFSVITVLDSVANIIMENARIYGIADKIASVRAVEIPVHELHADNERTAKALFEEGKKALRDDGAEVLVLGCTGMTGMAERLSKELNVPVLDPIPTAVKLAEMLVALGLSHSKIAFPMPPEKKRYY